MLTFGNKIQYHACCTPIDIRKGFDELSDLVRNYLKKDPLTGDVFVFLNKNKTYIKMLCWDSDGFVIFFKRLEGGALDLLKDDTTSRELKRDELLRVLEGIKLELYSLFCCNL